MADAGVTAEWFRAVDSQTLRRYKGFKGLPQRANSLSFRFLLRSAQRRGSSALLVIEDDAVFHPSSASESRRCNCRTTGKSSTSAVCISRRRNA